MLLVDYVNKQRNPRIGQDIVLLHQYRHEIMSNMLKETIDSVFFLLLVTQEILDNVCDS